MSGEPVVPRQDVVQLGNGLYMVRHISEKMCEHIWNIIDDNQRGELFALYGDDEAKALAGLKRECTESGHQAAFFLGTTLLCGMWAEWTFIGGRGNMRVAGCFCNTDYAKRHPLQFSKFTVICRDAFEIDEPPDVAELNVFIAKGFGSSRKWAAEIAGYEEAFDAECNGKEFVCYRREIGGGHGDGR